MDASTASRRIVVALLTAATLTTTAWGQAVTPVTPKTEGENARAEMINADDVAFAKRLSKAFRNVAARVEPSVVHITSLNRVTSPGNWINPGQTRTVTSGLGSGFVVSREGYVLTNNHVVRGADALRIKLSDGTETGATVVGRDEATDLAVLKFDPAAAGSDLVPVTFSDSDDLEVGEWVVAIGSPFGLSRTVTAGIVSARGRSISPSEMGTGPTYQDFIQTDAAINPGNSGGPLLNLQGQLVGVNSAIASRTGGYEGIGFAIPSNIARGVMESIIANGRVVRGWLGVELEDAGYVTVSGQRTSAVAVRRVVDDSPASRAGLREGDIITRFNARPVTEQRLRAAIATTAPGAAVNLDVLRDSQSVKVAATLGDLTTAMGGEWIDALGLSVRTITPEMLRGTRARVEGVVITELAPDGRGASNGLQTGDIILEVNSDDTPTAESFSKALRSSNFAQGIRLTVARGTMKGYLDIRE